MKKDMPLEGLRWSRDSGSALYDTPPNGRSRTGWGWGYLPRNLRNLFRIIFHLIRRIPSSFEIEEAFFGIYI